jgi:hypothetical protein
MNDIAQYPALLDPKCPWVELRQQTGLPNVKWCEQTLCSWVAEPANTWSNLGFIVVAVLLWLKVRKDGQRMLRFWAPAAFWVGATSFVYHASITFLTQVLDFFGMYIFFGLVVLLNLLRMSVISAARFFPFLWASIFGLTGLTVLVAKLSLPVQGIIGVLLLVALVTEVLATRRAQVKPKHLFLVAALVALGTGAAFSASDASGAWCDPSRHVIQGHAIWHLLTAVGIGFAHFHYRQFQPQLS